MREAFSGTFLRERFNIAWIGRRFNFSNEDYCANFSLLTQHHKHHKLSSTDRKEKKNLEFIPRNQQKTQKTPSDVKLMNEGAKGKDDGKCKLRNFSPPTGDSSSKKVGMRDSLMRMMAAIITGYYNLHGQGDADDGDNEFVWEAELSQTQCDKFVVCHINPPRNHHCAPSHRSTSSWHEK